MDIMDIPNGRSGNWTVEEFEVSENDANFFNLRCAFQPGMGHRGIKPGRYKRLKHFKTTVMSNTPAEIGDHRYFILIAEGDILINGLGLGVVLSELLKKDKVKSITVIEKSKDVIKLVGKHFEKDERVSIIHADAYKWKPPKGTKYNYVWHDIWSYISGDNVEGMKKLHRRYGRRTSWQGSWCRELCEMYR